jgi:hypothetical protein
MKTFAAIQFEGAAVHVSGLGATKAAAISDAEKLTDVSAGLRTLPITAAARDAVERLGGDKSNKVVTLAVITHAELKALEMLREIEGVILGAYLSGGRTN